MQVALGRMLPYSEAKISQGSMNKGQKQWEWLLKLDGLPPEERRALLQNARRDFLEIVKRNRECVLKIPRWPRRLLLSSPRLSELRAMQ